MIVMANIKKQDISNSYNDIITHLDELEAVIKQTREAIQKQDVNKLSKDEAMQLFNEDRKRLLELTKATNAIADVLSKHEAQIVALEQQKATEQRIAARMAEVEDKVADTNEQIRSIHSRITEMQATYEEQTRRNRIFNRLLVYGFLGSLLLSLGVVIIIILEVI